jgi:hypothetical protein
VTATVISRVATLWLALLLGFVAAPFVLGRTGRDDLPALPQERPATRSDITEMVRT